MTSSSTHAPPAVVAARASIRKLHRRVTAFVGSILGLTAGLVVAGEAGAPEAVVWTIVGTIGLLTVGAIPFLGGAQSKGDEETVREWESRGRRAEFDRFERARGADAAEDPRMGVAVGVIERIRSLPASDAETDAMVTRLERRVRRLVTDEGAARSAVEALRAAGAGGADRLEEAAGRLEAEVARILSGLSELYAALLEVEAGAHPAELEILSWLAAEAEIAGAALQAEAERPAAAADRAVREAEAERPPAAGGLAAPEVSRRTR